MKHNKKILSVIVVLAALVLILSGCQRDKNETPSPTPNEGEPQSETNATAGAGNDVVPVQNLVVIENGKFSPQTLTVPTGTTVTWTNKDTNAHWIITDPHPTHNILPDLDSKKGLLQNETYQFVFSKPGEYSYHDELNTTLTGKVVVQ